MRLPLGRKKQQKEKKMDRKIPHNKNKTPFWGNAIPVLGMKFKRG